MITVTEEAERLRVSFTIDRENREPFSDDEVPQTFHNLHILKRLVTAELRNHHKNGLSYKDAIIDAAYACDLFGDNVDFLVSMVESGGGNGGNPIPQKDLRRWTQWLKETVCRSHFMSNVIGMGPRWKPPVGDPMHEN